MVDETLKTQAGSSFRQAAAVIGSRLRELRDTKGLSQEEVAFSAGIAVFTYGKLERGESNPGTCANPRLQTLIRIARALEVDVQDLFPAEVAGVNESEGDEWCGHP